MDSSNQFETPIVLIMFNRPDLLKQVFDKIKQVRPKNLFIIADGPRNGNNEDVTLNIACKEVVGQVDWECTLHKNYSQENMGCGRRIASGLDWVFQQVDEAIILEDDCLPSISFFYFCQEMLERYRESDDIYAICGTNHRFESDDGTSYYFLHYFDTCGWATWSRAWAKYDWELSTYPQIRESGELRKVIPVHRYYDYWVGIFDDVRGALECGKILTAWSYQFYYTIFCNRGLCIYPNRNLIANIGYGENATHTVMTNLAMLKQDYLYMSTRTAEEISFPLVHPLQIMPNFLIDCLTMEKIFLPYCNIDRYLLRENIKKNVDKIVDEMEHTFVLVYGAGAIGRQVVHYLTENNVDNFAVVITDRPQRHQFVLGAKVRQIDDFADIRERATVLIATTTKYHSSIQNHLNSLGFKNCITAFNLY